jgi:hypothetical protein
MPFSAAARSVRSTSFASSRVTVSPNGGGALAIASARVSSPELAAEVGALEGVGDGAPTWTTALALATPGEPVLGTVNVTSVGADCD